MRFQSLERLINLHDGYRNTFKIDNLQLLLRQEHGVLMLLEAFCPHRAHPLAEAIISDGILECPLHGYRFAIANGRPVRTDKEDCRHLRVFELIYEGNEVGLMLDD
jgi:nitrite reductase/ring-hydroxylating ferredoxin subunit